MTLGKKKMKNNIDKIKNNKQFICWNTEERNGKISKIPMNPYGFGLAKVNDNSYFATFDEAKHAVTNNHYSGVGIVLTNGLCGIDIDAHNGTSNQYADKIISLFDDTYIEKSPSGNGYHILCTYDAAKLPILKDNSGSPVIDKNGKYKLDGYSFRNDAVGIEVYPSDFTTRYFTFTENAINDNDIVDKTDSINTLLHTYLSENGVVEPMDMVGAIISKARNASNGQRFSTLFDVGDISNYDYDHSRADLALCSMLAYWCNNDSTLIEQCFNKSALCREKWLNRDDYRERTISTAIKNPTKPYSEFVSTDGTRKPLTIDALEAWLDAQRIEISYNSITHEILVSGIRTELSQAEIMDNLGTLLFDKLKVSWKTNQAEVINYLKVIYAKHQFNPFIRYLAEQNAWDGIDRVSELYSIMRIADNDNLSKTLIHKWLRQAYALSFNKQDNPFGADGILVLQGNQGIGKSMLCAKLGINSDLGKTGLYIDTHDKDTIIRATSCFIGELGEIGCTLKSDIDRLKAFITESVDKYRVPYGRTDTKIVRRTSFIATTNDDRFLIDPTGSRRFWTIPCYTPFDLDRLSRFNVGQLWKQIENEMSGLAYSTDYGSAFQNAFRLTNAERIALEARNQVCQKPIKAELEVRDILETAANHSSDYDWKKTTITMWKNTYTALAKYSAEEVGKAVRQCGIAACRGTVNGVSTKSCYFLPFKNRHDEGCYF